MAFPADLTNAVDNVTDIIAAHLNNLEAKVGVDASAVASSLDYLVKNAASIDPGHKHTAEGIGSIEGLNTGDIIRWNAVTEEWESRAEPLEFQGIVLVPMTLPGAPAEGFVGYNIEDNGLYVAVE